MDEALLLEKWLGEREVSGWGWLYDQSFRICYIVDFDIGRSMLCVQQQLAGVYTLFEPILTKTSMLPLLVPCAFYTDIVSV